MQRHFSNRGEAIAEVTAARMLRRKRPLARSAVVGQVGWRTNPQWFSQPLKTTSRPRRKKSDRNQDRPPSL